MRDGDDVPVKRLSRLEYSHINRLYYYGFHGPAQFTPIGLLPIVPTYIISFRPEIVLKSCCIIQMTHSGPHFPIHSRVQFEFKIITFSDKRLYLNT